MSEPKLISPMLDNFAMGDPISDRNGVRCCPAMEKNADDRYIVKIISNPASQVRLDALLLSGAYRDKQDALRYFKELASGIEEEAQILEKLAQLEGFIPFIKWQTVPMEDDNGYDVYLLSDYHMTLQKYIRNHSMTHLEALNLGLDLCTALTVCRSSGYLYVDLKPSNIYITAERSYRIGDIGFLKLNTLKYASLPERCRSQYTAPEISDAYAALNTTLDIYAAGLILYQVFNNGALPFTGEAAPEEAFAPPAFADYEMAEIILKACAPDPADRWQDPAQMGQALVSYMQRNGAHDSPITPVATEEPAITQEEQTGSFEATEAPAEESAGEPETAVTDTAVPEEAVTVTEEQIYTEDAEGNLTFISDEDDETLPGDEAEEITYTEVSDEVSDMLTQADEIIAHQTPDPVVQPEPVEVTIPPVEETEENETSEANEETAEENETAEPAAETEEGAEEAASDAPEESGEETEEEDEDDTPRARKFHWLRYSVLILVLLGILAGGFLFYKHYYLQPIDAITLETGSIGTLTVLVTSELDEEKLTVICTDAHGNQRIAPVKNGKAVFVDLAPNSAYTVKMKVKGFHKLTGDTTAAYTTPIQTNIVQFTAVTGSADGNIILAFAIDGPDADQWRISYTGDNKEFKETVFAGHTLTLDGFTVGNKYTFTLRPDSDLQITGTTEVTYTASKLVKPEALNITGFSENKLSVGWKAPEGVAVESWTVRCYNGSDYDNTIVTAEPSASFEVNDKDADYTVEVTAAGMSVSERIFASASSLLINNFRAEKKDINTLALSWTLPANATQTGWKLSYTANGSAAKELTVTGSTAALSPVVPGATYVFTLQPADGSDVLGGELTYKVPDAAPFSAYGVSADNLEFMMCRQPSYKRWDRWSLSSSDYRTEFAVDEKGAFVIKRNASYVHTEDKVVTLAVIKDESGAILDAASFTEDWADMWVKGYCYLNLPAMPQAAGNYTAEIYFSGDLATSVPFTVK